jgi:hypothetical protein
MRHQPCVNPTLYHIQPCWVVDLDPFYSLGVFFSTLTILPSNLVTLIPQLPY